MPEKADTVTGDLERAAHSVGPVRASGDTSRQSRVTAGSTPARSDLVHAVERAIDAAGDDEQDVTITVGTLRALFDGYNSASISRAGTARQHLAVLVRGIDRGEIYDRTVDAARDFLFATSPEAPTLKDPKTVTEG